LGEVRAVRAVDTADQRASVGRVQAGGQGHGLRNWLINI
jgi:hypothetical protein